MACQWPERRSGQDRRSGENRRKRERRKEERRKLGINIELILQGIAVRRSGLARRQGERRKGDRRKRERRTAWCVATLVSICMLSLSSLPGRATMTMSSFQVEPAVTRPAPTSPNVRRPVSVLKQC